MVPVLLAHTMASAMHSRCSPTQKQQSHSTHGCATTHPSEPVNLLNVSLHCDVCCLLVVRGSHLHAHLHDATTTTTPGQPRHSLVSIEVATHDTSLLAQ